MAGDLVTIVGGAENAEGVRQQSLLVKLREGWGSRKDRKSGETTSLVLEGGAGATPMLTHEAAPPPGEGSFKNF